MGLWWGYKVASAVYVRIYRIYMFFRMIGAKYDKILKFVQVSRYTDVLLFLTFF